MDNETMVNIQETVVEEVTEPSQSIETVMTQEAPKPEPKQEPGYVKQRIADALAKERENIRAELNAEFQPIRDQLLEMQAEKLVASGDFKNLETAKEYLQLKQGVKPNEQPRNEKGQFTSSDPVIEARRDILRHQADKIKASTGIDVIAEVTDEDTRNRILGGEMDFYDYMNERKSRKVPPAPARSSNGASGHYPNIMDMSSKAFAEMDKRISEGARFGVN